MTVNNNINLTTTLVELPSLGSTAFSLTLTFPTQESGGEKKIDDRWVIICLDNSGSMSGSGISQAKTSISELMGKIATPELLTKVTLVEYNSYAKTVYQKGNNLTAMQTAVNKITAGGGTSFAKAFEEVSSLIHNNFLQTQKKEDISIVFFTDGCDNDKITIRQPAMQKLKETLERYAGASALHTIGFTRDHDARILSEITTSGTTQGTFQYVPSASDIKKAVTSLIEVLGNSAKPVVSKLFVNPISTPIEPFDKKVFFSAITQSKYVATAFLPSVLLDGSCEVSITAAAGDDEAEFTLNVAVPREELTLALLIQNMTTYVTDMLMQLSTELFGQSKPPVQELQNGQVIVKGYERQVQALLEQLNDPESDVEVGLEDTTQKKDFLRPFLTDTMAHITEFNKVIASAVKSNASNEEIAKLNAIAYGNVKKRAAMQKEK